MSIVAPIADSQYQPVPPLENAPAVLLSLTEEARTLWKSWGFDEALMETDPLSVHFLTESLLGETIALFQRSGSTFVDMDGIPNDLCVQNRNGMAFIKVEGEWVPCSAVINQVDYTQKQDPTFCVCSLFGWNFVHPDGLVRKDAYTYEEIYPVARLSHEVYQRVLGSALEWAEQHPEIDPDTEKNCALQVVTSLELDLTNHWWGRNLRDTIPQHTFTRLIGNDGSLYSFGSRSPYAKGTSDEGISSFLMSWSIHLRAPDYVELRDCPLRRVTNIPLSAERFQAILQFANVMNSGSGLRFNFLRQNCVRITQDILRIAGVDIQTKSSLSEVASAMLPSFTDIPVIGTAAARMAALARRIPSPTFFSGNFPTPTVPAPIKAGYKRARRATLYLPKKAAAASLSALTVGLLGAGKMAPRDETETKHQEDTLKNDDRLTSFERLVSSKNFADPETYSLYHNFKLIRWQDLQCSTYHYKNAQGFCVDPLNGVRP